MLADLLRQARQKRLELEAARKVATRLQKEFDDLETTIVEEMQGEAQTSIKQEGLTFYLRNARYISRAEGVSGSALVEALKSVGWEDCISANSQTLRSRVNEALEEERLPLALEGLLKITDKVELSILGLKNGAE